LAQSALIDTYPQLALLGHSHPAIARALAEQAEVLAFYSNVVPLAIRDRAADAIAAFASGALDDRAPWKVFFCNSGAEANENALKLALQQTGRRRIAAVTGGWHGRTLLALSATTDPKLTTPLEGVLVPCTRVAPNAPAELPRIDESVAAAIVEPILSIAGIVELNGEFLAALRKRCDEVGALLIYDEVQTGVGRLGRPLAAGRFGVKPDMVTLAKSLANGIPVGALLMNERVAARVKQNDLGSTFGGGPLACAAVLATLAVIEREGLMAKGAALGQAMHEKLRVGPVEAVLGCGCLIGLRTKSPAKPLQMTLLERGFVTGTSADPHVLRLMPPLMTPTEAIDELAAALKSL